MSALAEPAWPDPLPDVAVPTGLVQVATLNASGSEGFVPWLESTGATLLATTGDRLLTLGADDEKLVMGDHRVDVATGLATEGHSTLYLASRWQLHRLEDVLQDSEGPSGEDRLLLGQISRTTGFVGAYDVAVDRHGRVLFSNALCNCVATPADRVNFSVVFTPPFVSRSVAEERCHVTGLALDEQGELAYVTCAGETDQPDGWRAGVASGGVVVDVGSGETLARGLSLPFSPRVHEGRLFVTEAGLGRLVEVDRSTGEATPVVSLPGLARGLAFAGGRAVVGCSVPPREGPYTATPVGTDLSAPPQCGLAVVDVERGVVEHTLTLSAGSGDLHAVAVLPESRRVGVRLFVSEQDGWFAIGSARNVVD